MMLIVAQNEDLIDIRIRSYIHIVGPFTEVKNLQSQLQPISSALDKLQSDSATIADACEEWLDLLLSPDLEPYSDKVRHRFQQALKTDHYLANLIHPIYRRKKIDPSNVHSAQGKLMESSPDVGLICWTSFRTYLNGSSFKTYFVFTAAGIVPCGGRKTSLRMGTVFHHYITAHKQTQ